MTLFVQLYFSEWTSRDLLLEILTRMLSKATLLCMIGSAAAFAPGTPAVRMHLHLHHLQAS